MLKNKREWIQWIAVLGLATVCTACGPRPEAPAQNAVAVESGGNGQEEQKHEPRELVKYRSPGDGITVDGKKMTVIEDQSFDVSLEDWGDLRFLSCEPEDGEGQFRFVLEKDGKTVYVFPAMYDDSAFDWKPVGVNFVTFPDLNGDGRKDAIMSMNYVGKKSGAESFACAVVYRSEGDCFVINQEVTDLINESGHAGTVENVINKYDKYWAQISSKGKDFSVTIQECVRKDDRERLAALVRYPITVTVGGKELTFKKDSELIARYDDVFHEKFKTAILSVDPYESDSKGKGYELGDQLVTYGLSDRGSFQITGLNSDLKKMADEDKDRNDSRKK